MTAADRGSDWVANATKKWAALVVSMVLGVLLFGCQKVVSIPQPTPAVGSQPSAAGAGNIQSPPAMPVAVGSLDDLYSALAKRVNERVNEGGASSNDFLVTPFPFGEWELGTVLQQNRSVPVTYNACRPAPNDAEVRTQDVPTLFSSYKMNRDIGVQAGLDDAVFRGLISINGSANFGTSVEFAISDASTQVWSDVGLAQTLAIVSCRNALKPGSTYRLVRGLVSRKRQFAFEVNKTGSGSIKVPAVANLTLSVGANDSQVTVSDDHSAGFLAVISEFTVPGSPSTLHTQIAEMILAKPIAATVPGNVGKIYVQRDSADSPGNAAAVVAKLTAAHFEVANVIEKVPSERMPSIPQVRYFRPEDLDKAQQVLTVLRDTYPTSKLVTLRIPSPPGQLEVWLQKVVASGK